MENATHQHPPVQKVTQEVIADLRPVKVTNTPVLAKTPHDPVPYKGVLKPGEDPLYRSKGILDKDGKVLPSAQYLGTINWANEITVTNHITTQNIDSYMGQIARAYRLQTMMIEGGNYTTWGDYTRSRRYRDEWHTRGYASYADWCDETTLGPYGFHRGGTYTATASTTQIAYIDSPVGFYTYNGPPRIQLNYGTGTTVTVCHDPFGSWVADQEAARKKKNDRAWSNWNIWYEESREHMEARVANELEQERWHRQQAQEAARKAEVRAKLEREARIRAELLLMEFLDEQQKKDLIERNYFQMKTKAGNAYRIYRGAHANVYKLNEKNETIENLCAQPPNLPAEDVMLAQMLALTNNEEGFRKHAGISRIDPRTRVEERRIYGPPPHRANEFRQVA